MTEAKDAKARKQAQRARRAALGIKRGEVALSERERQQLETLRIARAGSSPAYSADEYLSTLIRRDWDRWQPGPFRTGRVHGRNSGKTREVITFDGVRKVIEPMPEHLKKPEWLWIRKLRTGRRQWLNCYTCHLVTIL